jgi:hypothetical protein
MRGFGALSLPNLLVCPVSAAKAGRRHQRGPAKLGFLSDRHATVVTRGGPQDLTRPTSHRQ